MSHLIAHAIKCDITKEIDHENDDNTQHTR